MKFEYELERLGTKYLTGFSEGQNMPNVHRHTGKTNEYYHSLFIYRVMKRECKLLKDCFSNLLAEKPLSEFC